MIRTNTLLHISRACLPLLLRHRASWLNRYTNTAMWCQIRGLKIHFRNVVLIPWFVHRNCQQATLNQYNPPNHPKRNWAPASSSQLESPRRRITTTFNVLFESCQSKSLKFLIALYYSLFSEAIIVTLKNSHSRIWFWIEAGKLLVVWTNQGYSTVLCTFLHLKKKSIFVG